CRCMVVYVMLVGAYPFEDPEDPRNIRKTIQRITVQEIEKHPWFLKNLLPGNSEGKCNGDKTGVEQEEEEEERFRQSVDEIVKIIEEA
ncbi:hypothetical protein HID58_013406, partial [Brassica napus]